VKDFIRWLHLNFKYRFQSLPNDPTELEKLANDLQIPLAFTYKAHGIDAALAQQRIYESLSSFRWSAPLILVVLSFVLMIGCILESLAFVDFADTQEAD
jgi:hypothetical protein